MVPEELPQGGQRTENWPAFPAGRYHRVSTCKLRDTADGSDLILSAADEDLMERLSKELVRVARSDGKVSRSLVDMAHDAVASAIVASHSGDPRTFNSFRYLGQQGWSRWLHSLSERRRVKSCKSE